MKKTYIPIGIDCSISHYLRRENLRYQAFPFDWSVTPTTSALSLIKNNFDGFLDLQNLEFLPPVKRLLFEEDGINIKSTNDVITPVVCHRYGILFPHDFSEAGINDFMNVKNKYERRIIKLMNLINDKQNLEFVYHCGQPNDWQLEQYKLSGVNFKYSSESEIFKSFEILQLGNSKINSLKILKRERMTWKEHGKEYFAQLKRILKK